MRERDENAYIRFFALWFAAGMTLGVLLLLTASHTGMKEGNSVRLFQAEAFFGRKISAKACFSYLQNGMAGLLFFFLALFPQIFLYLAALFLMAAACSRMAETNHLAGGIQKKEYFCFGVRYFFALILLLWGILLESYVNPWFLAKIL